MYVDTHIHLYDPAMGDFAWPAPGDVFHRLITIDEYAQALGSDDLRAVLVGCSNEYALNEKLCRLAESDPRLGIYIAQFDPADPAMPAYAKKLAQSPAYRGFRSSSAAILEHPQRVIDAWQPGTVIELHGDHLTIGRLYDLIAAHPEISFIIEHYAIIPFDGNPVADSFRTFCSRMASLSNVSIKMSGMFTLCRIPGKPLDAQLYCDAAKTVVDAFGPGRSMFGSDWPVMGVSLAGCRAVTEEIMRLAGCDAQAVAAIMGNSAARIYGIR